jgi:hypothetical protein
MIQLSYGDGRKFDEHALVRHIRASGRDYIIQGQQMCTLADHSKRNSLDYWLRQLAPNPNIKQADNATVSRLVRTGLFEVATRLRCPDSGRLCKGLRLAKAST